MKIRTRPLIVMHQDEQVRTRLRTLAGKDYAFRNVSSWERLHDSVVEAPLSSLVVIDPDAARDGAGTGALRGFIEAFPSIPVFAAVHLAADGAMDLLALAGAGVTNIVVVGHDDTGEALRARFRSAAAKPLKSLLDRVVPAELRGRSRALLHVAAEVVTAGGGAREMAARLGMSRRSLVHWTSAAALPPPRRMFVWLRVLLAAQLLDDPGRTVVSVARSCGYASDSGLRRVTGKFVRASPSAMRERGAFKAAAGAFLQALERYRPPCPAATSIAPNPKVVCLPTCSSSPARSRGSQGAGSTA